MNFLFLTTMMILIFTLISSSMTTSIKTIAFAAKKLDMQVERTLYIKNEMAKEKYTKSKKIPPSSIEKMANNRRNRAERRSKEKFVPRKKVSGENAKLNLYPLIKGDYTKKQKNQLKKILKNLLIELYKDEPFFKEKMGTKDSYLDLFIKRFLIGLKKDGALAKIFFQDQKERDFYLNLCRHDKGRSLLDYVTFQDDAKAKGISIINVHSEILRAMVDKKTYKLICEMERKIFYSGRYAARLKKAEIEPIIKNNPYYSIIRLDGHKKLKEKQTHSVLEGGHLITIGIPDALPAR